MRVIVTGGSGRAGQEVVRALDRAGHDVINIDGRPPDPALNLPGQFCRVELTDIGEVYDAFLQYRPEGVCHLAANPQPEGQARVDVFSNNTLSAYAVLQVAGDVGARRVVYASSETVTGVLHGERPSRIPFDESERHDAPNAYALSKYLSEVIADSMAVRYPTTRFVGLRLSNVIPANEVGRAMMAERREDPAKGMFNYWSYVDARDVGTAFQAALDGTSEGNEVFLVAAADTSSDRPLRELLETYYPGEGLAARVAPGHPDDASVFDCGKMRRYFGWEPQYSWRSGN